MAGLNCSMQRTGDALGRFLKSSNATTKLTVQRIACSIMALQQLTGVTFSSSYGPTFYRSVGLADLAFVYAVSTCLRSVKEATNAIRS